MQDPVVSVPAEPVGDVAVAITVSVQLSEKRSIVMQTYLPRDAAGSVLNGTLDKLTKAIDRQEAKYDLLAQRENLAIEEKTRKQMVEDYKHIEVRNADEWKRRNKKGDPQLSPNEAAQKQSAAVTIKRYDEAIAKRKADIAALEQVLAEET